MNVSPPAVFSSGAASWTMLFGLDFVCGMDVLFIYLFFLLEVIRGVFHLLLLSGNQVTLRPEPL